MTADAVGGVWRYSIDLAQALAARGVRTTIAVMGPSPRVDQRREAERAGATVLDRAYRLEWMEDPWDDVREAGSWLLTLERTLRPDVIHLNGYTHAALPWRSAVMVVAHSCVRSWWRAVKREEAPPRFDGYRDSVAAGLAAARLVVAPTEAMLRALRDEYGVGFPSRVIPNGCTAEWPAGPAVPRKEEFVFSAGRAWDLAKNIATLGRAAPRIAWPVYVAGERHEPGGDTCELAGVHALGHLSAAELAGWYGRAAIYALPARYEPFGLSVLEAARARSALVLGDIPSLRENWADAALFVPPDDVEALVAALGRLLSDPALREALALKASARAAAFTIDRTADGYLRAYEDVLA